MKDDSEYCCRIAGIKFDKPPLMTNTSLLNAAFVKNHLKKVMLK